MAVEDGKRAEKSALFFFKKRTVLQTLTLLYRFDKIYIIREYCTFGVINLQKPQIRLSVRDILEKEFKTSLKGYNPDEVDKFLDIIIQDYEKFFQWIALLERENEQLKKEIKKLKEQPQTPVAGSTNYDILQRLSNLEKKVFGSKLYD